MHRFLYTSFFLGLISLNVCATSGVGHQQQMFYKAYHALQSEDISTFHSLAKQLQNYPLHHYLQYLYLKPRLDKVSTTEINTFLNRYGNTYFGNTLRKQWLNKLATIKNWENFIWFYAPQKSVALQCDYIQARLITQHDTYNAVRDAKKLWLVGKSQPKNCDFAFDYLYDNKLITDVLLWQRIQLALEKGRVTLAVALAKRFSDPADKYWITRWKAVHYKPAQTLANFNYPNLPIVRNIITHGIKQLAKNKFDLAVKYWQDFQKDYAFSAEQIGELQYAFALASAKQDRKDAFVWLTTVNKDYLDKKLSQTRIYLALEKQNWVALADFIMELSTKEQARLQWQYWLARALEEMGKSNKANTIYKRLANERDYYGFLAADKINLPYKMQHHPISANSQDFSTLMAKKSIAAAYEFYLLSQAYATEKWLLNARREWHYAINKLSKTQRAIAAKLAHRWGWHDRAIITAAKASHYDDLDVRFPLAFYAELSKSAKKQGVDLSWAYGIIRQESLFMSKVRSHAGAMGLMQLMPATGRLVAKKLNIKLKKTSDILNVETNVNLGTGYLRQMLDRFDGNYMLATAAYNAGPGRAVRWAKKHSCVAPDLWVELIPFNETRTYVRRVLFYTRLFEYQLNKSEYQPLRIGLNYDEQCANSLYSQEISKTNKLLVTNITQK